MFLRASGSVFYDSNVFHLADELTDPAVLRGRGKSDIIWGLGGGLRCDVPVSQQRFLLDLSATKYKYMQFDELDYTGYSGRGTWEWKAGSKWSGNLTAGARQERQSYSDSVGFFIPSLVVYTDAGAEARYALTPRWELQASGSLYRANYDDARLSFDDFESETVAVGASYRSPAGNATGVRLRYEQGNWPNRPPVSFPDVIADNEYSQITLSAVVDWHFSGRSRLSGDAGYTWRDRKDAAGRDFDGLSGRLNYDYTISGKSSARASLYQTLGPIEDFTATYTKTTGIDLSFLHQLTGKIALEALVSYRQLDYEGESVAPGVQQREDRLTTFSVDATYRATRTISMSAGARYDQRTSNVPFGDYDVYTLYVSAGIEF